MDVDVESGGTRMMILDCGAMVLSIWTISGKAASDVEMSESDIEFGSDVRRRRTRCSIT